MALQDLIELIGDNHNNVGLTSVSAETLKLYCQNDDEELDYNKINTQLVLHWNEFLEALKQNIHITELDLSNLDLGYLGESLTEVLAQNVSIERLILSRNNFHANVANKMADLLRDNHPTLKELDLSHNPLGDEGCHSLMLVLKKNQHLVNLNLNNCAFSLANYNDLAQMLAVNTSLQVLKISHSHGNKVINQSKLMAALSVNKTLQELQIHTIYDFKPLMTMPLSVKFNLECVQENEFINEDGSIPKHSLFHTMLENFQNCQLQIEVKKCEYADFNTLFQNYREQILKLRSDFTRFITNFNQAAFVTIWTQAQKTYDAQLGISMIRNIDDRLPQAFNDRNALLMLLIALHYDGGKLTAKSFKRHLLNEIISASFAEVPAEFDLKNPDNLIFIFLSLTKALDVEAKKKYLDPEEVRDIKEASKLKISVPSAMFVKKAAAKNAEELLGIFAKLGI